MYKEYFGLNKPPFSIAPDPHYLYMSDNHREALAHLLYGINSDNGFVLLTGDVGTGKTTICRCLLEQLPENASIAFILNPKVNVNELLAMICDELGISYPAGNTSNKIFIDSINAYLIDANKKGLRTVLILEEAQNLSPEVLEQVRLLTNLETNERKLLQIIMIGQPELNDLLSRPELRQLKQRITARYHIGPLTKKEIAPYVLHRLAVAGVNRKIFPGPIIERLFLLSNGVPRMINLLCDRALLGAYVQGKSMVDLATLNKAAQEVSGDIAVRRQTKKRYAWLMISLLLVICGAVIAATWYNQKLKVLEEPKKPELQQLNVLAWPPDFPYDHNQSNAFKNLFRHWEAAYKPDEDACMQAQTQGLRCLRGPGSMESILKLNRPAVLRLFDSQGREFYVLLTGIKGQIATVEVGEYRTNLELKDIEKRWLGDFTMLWKAPPDYHGEIYMGMAGADLHWLDSHLAVINGRPASHEKHLKYDDNLIEEIKKFQLAEGLVPDGIVGAQTIIHLNTAAGTKTPKLTDRQGDSSYVVHP